MPFQIIRNDITKVKADAIVNTANPQPVIGGGTDGAIYAAAGAEQLLAERRKIGEIARGNAVSTPAFGLNARYIIHTVGPSWKGGNHGERETLHSCYERSLMLAADLQCESIAFPMISTGVYGFPKDEALDIALEEIGKFLLTHEMDVTLVVFDRGSVELSKKLVGEIDEYIDEHSVGSLRDREYSFRRNMDRSPRRSGPLRRMFESFSNKAYQRDTDEYLHARPMPASPQPDVRADMGIPADHEEIDEEACMAEYAQKESSAVEYDITEPMQIIDDRMAGSLPSYMLKKESAIPSKKAKADMDLDEFLAGRQETFQQRLFWLIDERGLKDPDVYKKANIDRKVFSKIRCNPDYLPKKKTAMAFAIALELDIPEMQDLLSRAGYALSPSSKFDLIISYFVEHKKFDINRINVALFDYGQELLGYK